MGFLKFSKLESQQTIRNVAVKTLKGISGLSMHKGVSSRSHRLTAAQYTLGMHAHNIISEFIKEFYRYF